MKKIIILFVFLNTGLVQAKSLYSETVTNLLTPESVIQAKSGDLFVSEINEFDIDGDGRISRIDANGKVTVFAKGMDDPKGLAMIGNKLYVADKTRILEVTSNGNWQVYAAESTFPFTPQFLNDLVADQNGNLYVSDSGNLKSGGAIYKIAPDGVVSVIVDGSNPNVKAPNGLLIDDRKHLLTVDFATGILYRINIATSKMTKLADGFGGGDGLIRTPKGTIYISDWKNGNIYLAADGKAQIVKGGFNSPADIAITQDQEHILIPVMKAGTLEFMSVK